MKKLLLLCAFVVSATVSCTENIEITSGKPIVIQGKLYRCTEKSWPE